MRGLRRVAYTAPPGFGWVGRRAAWPVPKSRLGLSNAVIYNGLAVICTYGVHITTKDPAFADEWLSAVFELSTQLPRVATILRLRAQAKRAERPGGASAVDQQTRPPPPHRARHGA